MPLEREQIEEFLQSAEMAFDMVDEDAYVYALVPQNFDDFIEGESAYPSDAVEWAEADFSALLQGLESLHGVDATGLVRNCHVNPGRSITPLSDSLSLMVEPGKGDQPLLTMVRATYDPAA